MPLKDSVKEAFIEQLEIIESRIHHFYINAAGQVAIGINHVITSEDAAAELPLYLPRCFGWWHRQASEDEKRAEYQFVQLNEPENSDCYSAAYYRQYTRLVLLDADIDKLVVQSVDACYAELIQFYQPSHGYAQEFDGFPEEVQVALLDMCFSLGMTALTADWPKLNGAIKLEDWKKAAEYSKRQRLSETRNRMVRQLFIMAAQHQASTKSTQSKAS